MGSIKNRAQSYLDANIAAAAWAAKVHIVHGPIVSVALLRISIRLADGDAVPARRRCDAMR